MNKYKYIYPLGVLLVYVLFCSKSCEEEPSEAEARKNRILNEQLHVIENGMESFYLNRKSTHAYLEKAKQKIIEFADYLSFYSAGDLDSVFKSSLEFQIKSMFLNHKIEIEYADCGRKRKLPIDEFLDEISTPENDQVLFKIDSIQIYQPLKNISEHKYRGAMSYLQITSYISLNDTVLTNRTRMFTEFYVKKVRKQFGSKVKYVWQVYLGDMNIYSKD